MNFYEDGSVARPRVAERGRSPEARDTRVREATAVIHAAALKPWGKLLRQRLLPKIPQWPYWDMTRKKLLVKKAFDALPTGGVGIVFKRLIG